MADQEINQTNEEEFKDPLGVTAVEQENDKVKVEIVIPGMTVKTRILKGFSKEPSNALIEPPEFTEWGFNVIVRMTIKGKSKPQNYRARIKKLPGPIDPDKCTFGVKKEQVILFLQKKTSRSWAAKLSEYGLEQDEEEEMEET